jgi:eukaryotic-like serine/threonine-protein kinase
MGEVYKARDTRLGRDVAVKVLPEEFAPDPERLHRFEQEARAAAALNHPNILVLYDIGTHEGTPYIVTELLEGETLRQRLRGGALNTARVVDFGVQVAKGLAAAHEKGIIHRDLKPENLFVTKDGRVKILDFGLARLRPGGDGGPALSQAPTADTPTREGKVLGTVGYMAPEQVRGQTADARSDLFAFGCVLYEMVSGKQAFLRETSAETMTAILREEPPELAGTGRPVSPGLERVVRRCLEKEPGSRFQSASDLAFALDAISQATTTGTAAVRGVATRKRKGLLLAGALCIAVLAAAAGAGLYVLGRHSIGPAVPSYEALTFQKGTVEAARFSPDGNTVYYSAAWGGKPTEVFSRRLDTVESQSMGVKGGEVQSVSAGEMAVIIRDVSPAGQDNLLGGTLARVPLSGGPPRPILDGVWQADYAPGTDQLAVILVQGGRWRLEFPVGKVLHEEGLFIAGLRFSPSGEHIAFFGHMAGETSRVRSLILMDRKGQKRALFSDMPGWSPLAWSPDGKEIYYTRSGVPYAVDLKGRTRLLARAPQGLWVQDVSPSGALLVTQGNGRNEVFGLLAGDAKQRELSYLGWTWPSSISPDGTALSFTDVGGVYLQKADGSAPLRMGPGGGGALSPDGKWVNVGQDDGLVHLLPTGTGSPLTLPKGDLERIHPGFWFPSGKRIEMVGFEKGKGGTIYVQDLPDGLPRALGEDLSCPFDCISSDSKWVAAFVKPKDSLTFTYALYPADGGAPRAIPGLAPGDHPVQFSEDGRYLFVYEPPPGPVAHIARLDLTTGKREPWWTLSPPDPAGISQVGTIVMTRSGKYYAVSYQRVLSTLNLMEGVK